MLSCFFKRESKGLTNPRKATRVHFRTRTFRERRGVQFKSVTGAVTCKASIFFNGRTRNGMKMTRVYRVALVIRVREYTRRNIARVLEESVLLKVLSYVGTHFYKTPHPIAFRLLSNSRLNQKGSYVL